MQNSTTAVGASYRIFVKKIWYQGNAYGRLNIWTASGYYWIDSVYLVYNSGLTFV